MNTTNDTTTHILARLEVGLCTDSERLLALDKEMSATLQCARDLGSKQLFPANWNSQWQLHWDDAEDILQPIRRLVHEMDYSIKSDGGDRLAEAMGAWDAIQLEDAKLVIAFAAIREQASGLSADVRSDWNILARALESQLETIHACAQAMRIKLELLKEHSKEEVDRLVQGVLCKLPSQTDADRMNREMYEQELDAAAIAIEQEQHQPGGFMDTLKAMFMWIEAPEERVRKNLSLQVI